MQRVIGLAACALIAAGGAAAGRLALPTQGLRGHYFTNLTRSGPPIAVAIDRSPSTDTLDNGTAGVWPAFSVEWTGFLIVDRDGRYEFAVTSDDGSALLIDDRVVVSNGGQHGPQQARGSIELTAGLHPIRLQYEQAGGGFALAVVSGLAGEPMAALPPSRLTPDAMRYQAYRLRRAVPWAGAALALALWVAVRRRFPTARGVPHDRPAEVPDARRTTRAIATIVVVAVAARVCMLLGSDAILWGDSDVFLSAVDAIRAGRYLAHDPFRTLLYPYFLAPFLIVSTEPPMDQVIVAAQYVLGVAAAVCFYLAGRRAFGSGAALIGSLLFAVHTTQLFYETSILSEALFVFLLAAAVLVIGRFADAPSWRSAAAAAAACAALTYTRPVAQWYFLVPVALALVRFQGWRQRLGLAAAVTVTFAMLMLPWALLNQRQFGFFGIAIGRGFGLYIRVFDVDRLDPPADTRYPEARDVLMRARAIGQFSPATYVRDWLGDRQRYSMIQRDQIMAAAATETALSQPLRFAGNSLRQWALQLSGPLGDEAICTSSEVGPYVCSRRTIGYAREPFLNRPRHADQPVREWVVRYFRYARIPITVVSVLAAFGVVACLAQPAGALVQGILLAMTVEYFTFIPAFAQSPQDRYRLPVDALLFMFAVFGVRRLLADRPILIE